MTGVPDLAFPGVKVIKSVRLSDYISFGILSSPAELFAIMLALKWKIDFNPLGAVIFSNSLSGVKVLKFLIWM